MPLTNECSLMDKLWQHFILNTSNISWTFPAFLISRNSSNFPDTFRVFMWLLLYSYFILPDTISLNDACVPFNHCALPFVFSFRPAEMGQYKRTLSQTIRTVRRFQEWQHKDVESWNRKLSGQNECVPGSEGSQQGVCSSDCCKRFKWSWRSLCRGFS